MEEKKIIFKIENVSKSFYGSHALKDVSLDIFEGEVHILCGENGAGKSTLMKILSGVYQKDKGDITYFGEPYGIHRPSDAEFLGVATIHQESNLSMTNTVAENIFLHREPGRFLVDRKKLHLEARRYLDIVGCNVSTHDLADKLSAANQQLVQIAKALSQNAKVLIMDEPVSSISEEDTLRMFELINNLKKQGIAIIYIDHRIDNFKIIGDRISVLRDGEMIGTYMLSDCTKDDIIRMMVGRDVKQIFSKTNEPKDEVVFEIRNYSNYRLKNVSFTVRKGEVFGLAGLVGAGRSEIVRAIFGIDPIDPGSETFIGGETVTISTPNDAVKKNIAYIPEDRKAAGFVPGRSMVFNLVLSSLDKVCKYGLVNTKEEQKKAQEQIDNLRIRTLKQNAQVKELSGGNQQKIVIGKWLMREGVKVLLMDEPTRGIDIGVKMEIYKLIDKITTEGKAVILITSEMGELIGMCDRIAAVKDGKIMKIFTRNEFSQEAIMKECV